MALAAARTTLGDTFEVRDIRFEQMLLLDDKTPVHATASVASPGVINFLVETDGDAELVRRATAVLHATGSDDQPPAHDMAALLGAHPHRTDGNELRQWFDERGIQYGPAFTGLAAVCIDEAVVDTVLAEVTLPRSIRSQQDAYGVHPALLDACFQSVAVHPGVQSAGSGGLLLPLGVRRLRSYGGHPQRSLLLHTRHQWRRQRGRGQPGNPG
jgi:polyketide synthase 5